MADLLADPPERGENSPVGIVLVDENAVRGTRRGLLERLRSRYAGIPVVLLGGAGDEPHAWSDVIPRPTTIDSLVARLERHLGLGPHARDGAGLPLAI